MTEFLDETSELLARTPTVLQILLTGLPDAWTGTADTADGWRPRDIIGHLITGEQVDWLARMRLILEHGTDQPFERFDRLAMLERDAGIPLDELVERFAALRVANLAELHHLVTEADLERQGIHPGLGEVTLRQLLAAWTVHDLDHLAQIAAGVAGARDTDVGPWKRYLGILLRRDDAGASAG